jgi:hypothetical protein
MTGVNFQVIISWYLFNLATISQQFLFLTGYPQKLVIVQPHKKSRQAFTLTTKGKDVRKYG